MTLKEGKICYVILGGKLYRGIIISSVSKDNFVLKINPPYPENKNAEGEIYFKEKGERFYIKAKLSFINETEANVKILSSVLPDRRENIRVKIPLYKVKLRKGIEEIEAKLEDISYSGARIFTDYPLKKGEKYVIEIIFNKSHFRGESMVIDLYYIKGKTSYGLSFKNISRKDEEVLEKFFNVIEENEQPDYYIKKEKIYSDILGSFYTSTHKITGRNYLIREINKNLVERDFTREIDKIISLSHPNLLKINRIIKKGNYFIIMEKLKGENLTSLIGKKGAFSIHSSIEIILQILEVISHLKKQGADFSFILPSGIFIEDNGEVKITDILFTPYININNLLKHNLTASYSFSDLFYKIEVPHYISPSLKKGGKKGIKDCLYSVGCLLYKMTTGILPVRENKILDRKVMSIIIKLTSGENLDIESFIKEAEEIITVERTGKEDAKGKIEEVIDEKGLEVFEVEKKRQKFILFQNFFKNLWEKIKNISIKYFYFKKGELFRPRKDILLITLFIILFIGISSGFYIFFKVHSMILILKKPPAAPPARTMKKMIEKGINKQQKMKKVYVKLPGLKIPQDITASELEEIIKKYKLPVYTIKGEEYISLKILGKLLNCGDTLKEDKNFIFFKHKGRKIIINLRRNEITIDGEVKRMENPVKIILEEKLIPLSTVKKLL